MFDQGMAQAFGFNHEAAIRSFERAAELDTSAAMPHWGKAWALGPNYNLDIDDAAREGGNRGGRQGPVASPRTAPTHERAYVDALAVRYSADPKADRPAMARAFSQAMGDLSRKYPDDLDAAVIYAESVMNLTPWKLWTLDGKPTANTERIVGVLESVLLRNPNHLGANHYYIHAVEASRTPARALTSARATGHALPSRPATCCTCRRTSTRARAITPAPRLPTPPGAAADRRYSRPHRRTGCTG